jgi:hypothetical protein
MAIQSTSLAEVYKTVDVMNHTALNLFRDIFPAARCVLLICFLSTTNTPQLAARIFISFIFLPDTSDRVYEMEYLAENMASNCGFLSAYSLAVGWIGTTVMAM